MALDNGTPALSATQSLTIIVVDVNDEVPVFTRSLYESFICENEDPGAVVIKVEAIDKDSGSLLSTKNKKIKMTNSHYFDINL